MVSASRSPSLKGFANIAATVFFLSGGVAAAASTGTWKPLGFAQFTVEQGNDQDGIDFGADRIRAGVRYDSSDLFGGLVLDFNVNNGGNKTPGTLTNMIKDVYVGWKFSPVWSGKLGQFKTPVGMDFNTSGAGLDITKRGMEKPLVLERDLGVMVSARNLPHGFGLDLGIFNPAGRSGATAHQFAQEGEDNAWAARLLWDCENWHLQASMGSSADAGGPGTENYDVLSIGSRYKQGPLTLKFEWVSGSDVLGIADRDERVAYGHVGYRIQPDLELIARHYDGESELAGGAKSDLGNTYLGLNWWPKSDGPAALRLQFNYVIASGDEMAYTGLGGFRDNAFLLQLQLAYR